ncbi:MAG: acyltransferase family protein [Fimbriimonas sp.]
MPHETSAQNPVYERLPFLEGLRGLAALYVVLGHICSMADPSKLAWKASSAPVWLQGLFAPFQYGNLAVATFIVLSGFCLQLALFTRGDGRIRGLGRWFTRRWARILPPYYGALALSLIVATTITMKQPGMPFQHYLPITDEGLLAHLFLVHNLSTEWMYKINGVMWSIGLEAQLYLLFPLLLAMLFKAGRTLTLALSIATAALAVIYLPNASKLYAWYLPLFVLGMVSANLAYRPNLTAGIQPALAAMLALLGFFVAGFACHHGWAIYTCDSLVGLGVAALCYLLMVSSVNPLNRFLAWRPLVWLGGFSYSLYLMHHPIEQIVYAHRPAGTEGPEALFWYLLWAGLPLMILGSWVFSLVFERPFVARRARHAEQERLPLAPTSLPLKPFGSDHAIRRAKLKAASRERSSEPVPQLV